MSHYSSIKTQIASVQHLLKALAELGYRRVEVHDEPRNLVGWLGEARRQRAEVIIRKETLGHGSNDVGFQRQPDGTYRLVVSEFDAERQFGPAFVRKLMQRYAYHVAKDTLEEDGFSLVSEEAEPDETIRLTLRRMA